VSVFTGLDLKGWTTEKDAWKANGGRLVATGKADLVSEKKYGHVELIYDWRAPAKGAKAELTISCGGAASTATIPAGAKAGGWTRATATFNLRDATAPLTLKASEGVEVMNLFVRELKEKK
jgi:hypothetical protein